MSSARATKRPACTRSAPAPDYSETVSLVTLTAGMGAQAVFRFRPILSMSLVGTPPALRHPVVRPSTSYEPRDPAQSALYHWSRWSSWSRSSAPRPTPAPRPPSPNAASTSFRVTRGPWSISEGSPRWSCRTNAGVSSPIPAGTSRRSIGPVGTGRVKHRTAIVSARPASAVNPKVERGLTRTDRWLSGAVRSSAPYGGLSRT